ncbi:MAG: WG repeat-containing protein [Cyclobacteriaceae bacterium]|nr:WG repeat-containing protein [Cyclobacteriaceae bacterium]
MRNFLLVACSVALATSVYAGRYLKFEENGRFGVKNETGEVLIPAVYEAIGWSNNSFSIVNQTTGYKLNNQWGLISLTNKQVTAADFFSLEPAEGNLLIATKRSALSFRITAGCIDTKGKTIISFQYAGIRIQNLRAIVYTLDEQELKYGLIGLDNKVLIPQVYKNIYPLGSLRYAVQNFTNKTALFTESGKQITAFSIDSISSLTNNMAVIYQQGKQGLINRDGTVITEPVYRDIELDSKTVKAKLPDTWLILDAQNKLIREVEADSLLPIGNERLKRVNTFGSQLLDTEFNPVSSLYFTRLDNFKDDKVVFYQNDKAGLINREGSLILPAEFNRIIIDDDYFIVSKTVQGKRTWALLNKTGNALTTKTYESIEKFNGTFFPVRKNGFYGGVDTTGREIIACVFDSLSDIHQNLVAVKFKGQYGIIDTDERWIVTPQANPVSLLNSERYFEQVGDLTFLKSITGEIIYFTTNPLKLEHHALVETISSGGKWTINFNGQIIQRELPPNERAEEIYPSSEGYRGLKKNGRYGFIDDQGRLRIANRYEGIQRFSEGLAAVKIRGRWGYLNKEDNIVIQPVYEEVMPFSNGYAVVKQQGKYGLIYTTGKIALDIRYDNVELQENGRIKIFIGNRAGLADSQGNVLLQPKYDSVEDLNNGYVIVRQYEKFGLVTLHGVSTIPIQYDMLLFEKTSQTYLALKKNKFQELKF